MDLPDTTPPDLVRATAAGGALHRDELLALGLSPAAIASRLRRGTLVRLHERVYLCPHLTLDARTRWRAGVKACPGAALGRVSGGAYWHMCRDRAIGVEVVTTGNARGTRDLVVHRTRSLPDDHWVEVDGMKVCTPVRILLDMAPHWSETQLLAAAHEAEFRGTLDIEALLALDVRGRRGARRLETVQTHFAEGTRSELEALLRDLCIKGGLPEPAGQHRVGRWQVDVAWPELRFGVEAQSWKWHRTRAAFERDARKQLVLAAKGWEVVRVTWRGVQERPDEVLRALRARVA